MRPLLMLGLASVFCLIGCGEDGLAPTGGSSDLGTADAALIACNAIATPTECAKRSDCEPYTCPGCSPTNPIFGCVAKGAGPGPVCPAIECPVQCNQHMNEASCSADSSCFAVFKDPGTCDCVAGCCMQYALCAPKPATCASQVLCEMGVVCGPGFSPIYENGCSTGCVRDQVCLLD